MKIKLVYCFTLIFLVHAAAGQSIGVGKWRSHLSYYNIQDIAVNNNHVLVRTNGGIFTVDPQDFEINAFSPVNGLRRSAITAIALMDNRILVGYKGGGIDIVDKSSVIRLDDILNSGFSKEKKEIRSITTRNNRIVVSTGFGVVVLNSTTLKVVATYSQLGENGEELAVFDAVENDEVIVAATTDGLLVGSLDPGVNLQDYNQWMRFPAVGVANRLGRIVNSLYAAVPSEGLYGFETDDWNLVDFDGESITTITSNESGLGVCMDGSCHFWTPSVSEEFDYPGQGTIRTISGEVGGDVWVGTDVGLTRVSGAAFEEIVPNGPFSPSVMNMSYLENQLVVTSGGYSGLFTANGDANGLYLFRDNQWDNVNAITRSSWSGLLDPVQVVFDPLNNAYTLATFQNGLYSLDMNFEATLLSTPFDAEKVTNLHMDGDGLWVVVSEMAQPLWHRSTGGAWSSVSIVNAPPLYSAAMVSDNQYLYILIHPTAGDGIVMLEKSSGNSRILNKDRNEGDLPGRPLSMTIDKNGDLWVGTSNGVAFFNRPQFDSDINAFTPILEFVPLLRGNAINDIEVDGANRKWIATSRGVWLVSAGGDQEVLQFNTVNSPLLNDGVSQIAIDPETGEVFFQTLDGLISYRGDATEGKSTHSAVKVFPNPVGPEFKGVVAMSGLVDNAEVKITDVTGRLVFATRANGGTASWDLRSYNGSDATTGIYLVYSTDADGKETFVGKLAVVR